MSKENEIDSHECPLCMEPFELDDLNFYPCACEYQICRFCWHRIKTDESGLCPACRQPYTENPAEYTPLTQEQITKLKQKKKTRSHEKKQKQVENRKNLSEVRVVQKNLVFVVGLSKRLADAEVLKRPEYFGKFGKIQKIVINTNTVYHGPQGPSVSAYVTYLKTEDASTAIQAVNNAKVDGRILKVSFGTTKYCSNFLKGAPCPKTDCMYLHELGEDEASFTKEDMAQGKHQLYETETLLQARDIIYKEPPVRRTTPTQQPKIREVPKVSTPPISQSALPASASWASRTTQSKDATDSPPKRAAYLPPSTQQPKGPLVQSSLDPDLQSAPIDTKNRQLTPDRSPLSNSSPLREDSSPSSSYSDQPSASPISPTRGNGEGDLDTLSPITPTHESTPPSDMTPTTQQSNSSPEVNNNNKQPDLFTETNNVATIQTERNPYPSFTKFPPATALDLGILGTAWGNSDPTEQSFTAVHTPLTTDTKWEYLHSDLPLTSDSQIPLHRTKQPELSLPSHEPILGLDLTAGNSVTMKENMDQIKGLAQSNSEDLRSRRVSLGNIQVDPCIIPFTHDPLAHSLQNLGLSDPPNRNRSATTVSHDIHLYPEHSRMYNQTTPLDRRNSVDGSVKSMRPPYDNMDMYHRHGMYPMKHHNFIGPTTPNSTHFNPAPSNDRMGMELNRNYDMNHIMPNQSFTPLMPPPPPGHMEEWYKLQDPWQHSGMPQPNHSMRHRPPEREDIFKSPGAEKQGLLGGGNHWGSVPTLTEPEVTHPPGFGTTNHLYQTRPMTQFPNDTPKSLIDQFQHSGPEQLYPRHTNNNFPIGNPMEHYSFPHSNPYSSLPRERSYPMGQFMDCQQPLIYQTGSKNLDQIDPPNYYKQTPEFDVIYSNQVKNKPKQQIYPRPPRPIGINYMHNDPGLTNEKPFSDTHDLSQQNTRYL